MRLNAPGEVVGEGAVDVGAALFGVGWGASGFCPGPAVVAMASGGKQALAFVAAMLVGMLIKEIVFRKKATE